MPTTTDIFLDTNILLRTQLDTSALTTNATRAMLHLLRQKHKLVTSVQNLAEFWNVSTRPDTPPSNGYNLSPLEVYLRLTRFEQSLTILCETPSSYRYWKKLVMEHEVRGKQVHDARLAAVMLTSDIHHILTFNVKDFRRFPQITPLHPDEILDDFKI